MLQLHNGCCNYTGQSRPRCRPRHHGAVLKVRCSRCGGRGAVLKVRWSRCGGRGAVVEVRWSRCDSRGATVKVLKACRRIPTEEVDHEGKCYRDSDSRLRSREDLKRKEQQLRPQNARAEHAAARSKTNGKRANIDPPQRTCRARSECVNCCVENHTSRRWERRKFRSPP